MLNFQQNVEGGGGSGSTPSSAANLKLFAVQGPINFSEYLDDFWNVIEERKRDEG